jgi:hypothetical protein
VKLEPLAFSLATAGQIKVVPTIRNFLGFRDTAEGIELDTKRRRNLSIRFKFPFPLTFSNYAFRPGSLAKMSAGVADFYTCEATTIGMKSSA